MDSQLYEIDPDGDVILTLHNPNAPFAVWQWQHHPWGQQSTTPGGEQPLLCGSWTTPFGSGIDPGQDAGGTANHGAVTAELEPTVPVNAEPDGTEPNNDLPEAAPDSAPGDDQLAAILQPQADPGCTSEIRMRLSSRHLVLASPYFRKMLRGEWQEANPQPGREHCIEAEGWDVEALLLLMRVIHGRNRNVPRSVDLEMLAKIAVLVDYYQCHESVDILRQLWIAELRRDLPSVYGRDLVLCLFVAWVFSEDEIFRIATKIMGNTMTDNLATFGLPIPEAIVEAINRKRRDPILHIILRLKIVLRKLRGRRLSCSFECSSTLLGALTIQLHENGLLEAEPESSFPGRSAESVLDAVSKIQSPPWRRVVLPGTNVCASSHDQKHCDLAFIMQPFLKFSRELVAADLSLADCLVGGDQKLPVRRVAAPAGAALELSLQQLALEASSWTDFQHIPSTAAARGYQDTPCEGKVERLSHICTEPEFVKFSPEELRLAHCYSNNNAR
ncbi:BTB/POZ domain-containing protein [Microdochium nivale]|nr:BTB/POZ domain-containing protein [Microdochium nivale]